MSSIKSYIESLNFDYIKTYSGFRGEQFEQFKKECVIKIKALQTSLETARHMQQTKIQKEISDLEEELWLGNIRVINKDGTLHQSGKMIAKIQKEDKLIQNIFDAFTLPIHEVYHTLCIPIFRDVIVFYSKENTIVGILHLCFECTEVKNENEERFDLNQKSYGIIKNILKRVGHQIDD